MYSNQQMFVRQSPYMKRNLEKYHPESIIPLEGTTRNHLFIKNNVIDLKKAINYQNYRPQTTKIQIEQLCYFCKKEISSTNCGECGRVVCPKCLSKCGKCGKILCSLNRTYNYQIQSDCCYDC